MDELKPIQSTATNATVPTAAPRSCAPVVGSAFDLIINLTEDPRDDGTYELHLKGADYDRLYNAAMVDANEVDRLHREIAAMASLIEESPYFGKITAAGPTGMLNAMATACRMILDPQNEKLSQPADNGHGA